MAVTRYAQKDAYSTELSILECSILMKPPKLVDEDLTIIK